MVGWEPPEDELCVSAAVNDSNAEKDCVRNRALRAVLDNVFDRFGMRMGRCKDHLSRPTVSKMPQGNKLRVEVPR